MLTIQPILGLCNRMRALDSAISLAKAVDLPVRLVWLVDRHLGCRFEDLFERPAEITEIRTIDRTLGVHIRRTDHVHARRMSPTVGFLTRIEAAIAAGEADTVFVATDDPVEEDALRRAFPGRILSFPKRSLDRASPEAIQDALVDLHCLASTDRLLASYWSTFSETAVQIGSIPVDIVKVGIP